MRKPFVAGNWKMHGTQQSCTELLQALKKGCAEVKVAELAVFPPFPFLALTAQLLQKSSIAWGAQNLCDAQQGAFTGEVSASMLSEYGCHYVIIGHSERRQLYGETNEMVAAKFSMAIKANINPVICVGETEQQREAGDTLSVILNQLAPVLTLLDDLPEQVQPVVAYEPVWAIGTGQNATPEQAQQVHVFIREQLALCDKELAQQTRVLYGGSVKPANASELFAMPDIDGALVGGASLQADQFLEIGKLCNNLF